MSKIRGLLGKKVGMTQVFGEDGSRIPVTVLQVGPCTVVQKKRQERDGYNALQLGFQEKPLKRLNMPERGKIEKLGLDHGFRYLREIKVDDPDAFEEGQVLTLEDAAVGLLINIVGTAKGRGFAGTVKRHGFSRGPMGHGSKHHRAVGSAGMSAYPGKVIKGKKMPGRMGNMRHTVKNSMVVDVRPENNLLLVKGPVPGAVNQMVIIDFI